MKAIGENLSLRSEISIAVGAENVLSLTTGFQSQPLALQSSHSSQTSLLRSSSIDPRLSMSSNAIIIIKNIMLFLRLDAGPNSRAQVLKIDDK